MPSDGCLWTTPATVQSGPGQRGVGEINQTRCRMSLEAAIPLAHGYFHKVHLFCPHCLVQTSQTEALEHSFTEVWAFPSAFLAWSRLGKSALRDVTIWTGLLNVGRSHYEASPNHPYDHDLRDMLGTRHFEMEETPYIIDL